MSKHLALLLLTAMLVLAGCARLIDIATSEPIYVNPGERTRGAKIDDSSIETIAKVNLYKADEGLFDGRVFVNSYNAVVLLTGQVASARLRQLAGETVEKIHTVRQVHNELQVAPLASVSTRAYDTWLTAKINTKLVANSVIPSDRIRVITENKTVFLMGLLSRREAENVTDVVSRTRGVKKVVKVFEYID